MARKAYDPLAHIPPPKPILERLTEVELLAERLRVLLRLSRRLHGDDGGEPKRKAAADAR